MEFFNKNSAIAIGILYVLGVLVTAVHLSRFAIYDLDLTKLRYIFAGGICCYYLVLRFIINALILDFHIIRFTRAEARDVIYKSLKDKFLFKTIDMIASKPYIGFFFKQYSTENISIKFINYLSLGALLFIFIVFFFFLSFPMLNVSTLWQRPPFYLMALIIVQLAYLSYYLFKEAMQSTAQLKYLWKIVLVLVVIADIGVYALVVHPLVKPVFGGGVVLKVNLIPKDQKSSDLIEQATGIIFTRNKSESVLIVHTSDRDYYLTKRYDFNYASTNLSAMIQHGEIYRIKKELISGYEIIGFE